VQLLSEGQLEHVAIAGMTLQPRAPGSLGDRVAQLFGRDL
jgi:hypothetical protein